jgi:hypothetical protein
VPAGAISRFAGLTSLIEAMSHARLGSIVTHHGRGHEVQPLFNPLELDSTCSFAAFSFTARRAAASYLFL